VGYQGSSLLWTLREPNHRCRRNTATRSFEGGCSVEASKIGQQEGRNLSTRQRPATSLRTREKLLEFSWNVLPHPPDLASSDYYLFRSLQNSLDGKNFPNPDAIKIHLKRFFAEKPKIFWEMEILDLPIMAMMIKQKGYIHHSIKIHTCRCIWVLIWGKKRHGFSDWSNIDRVIVKYLKKF